jgi:CRP-like cAMP-binding protein
VNFLWENLFRRNRKRDELRTALRENILFEDLSERELKFLENIVHIRRFHAGEPIFRQGEIGVGMYIIVKGSVEIFSTDATKMGAGEVNEALITQLAPGDFFGDLALVEVNGRRTASAIAQSESTLIGFFKPDLLEILARKPQTGIKILFRLAEVVGRRLKKTSDKVTELQDELNQARETINTWKTISNSAVDGKNATSASSQTPA